MNANRDGKVVTFYSYKGGTGRTMALANVAWILAANGKRVLVVDWDLESPGLDRFFAPFMDPTVLSSTNGVIDLIRTFEWEATRDVVRDDSWHEEYASVHKYSFSLDWDHFPGDGTLDFLSSGRQNRDYATAISGINWDDFYDRQGGGVFFDALRADMKRNYDYTLIDSRTGLSDVADICTMHLPDILVDCFTLSEQGISGAKQIADLVRNRSNRSDRAIRILPVPMRVDPAEKRKADAGRLVAKQRFQGLPDAIDESERDAYWSAMQIPYQAYYGYEESLATFGDTPGSHNSLLSHYEILARYVTAGEVTALPRIDDGLRRRMNERFVRRPEDLETEVLLEYEPADQVWAEWIEHVLLSADVRVLDPWIRPADAEQRAVATARVLRLVSRTDSPFAVPDDRGTEPQRDPLIVYVADVPPLAQPASYVTVAGLEAAAAAALVLRLVGRPRSDAAAGHTGPRFPGNGPLVFNVPSRNLRFTGREDDLLALRARLRGGPPVGAGATTTVLQGMGGLGKTLVALEYAHRFRAAYDVVYWISADPFTFIDSQLIDLAAALGVPAQSTGPDTTRAVIGALGRGEPYSRWLLIYDNAEDDRVEQFLPRGPGHVVVTSRDPAWNERATPMHLDVFSRTESIALILKRNPALAVDQASRVADAVGDLPIAVSAAGAWLADTGAPVKEYLEAIERKGPDILKLEGSADSVAATWNLSLQRLQERSSAASRLLQLCSVLASEIALELVHSDALASVLRPLDPSVSERVFRGALVQQMNRLALLRVDQRGESTQPGEHGDRAHGGQIIVHRLLQLMVRSQMSDEELNNTRHEMHEVLANIRPDGEVDDPDTWPKFRMLWPQLEVSDAVNCPAEKVRRLMIDRVRYLWLRGDLERAQQRAERTDEAWTALLERTGEPSEHRALVLQLHHLRFNHANILRSLGRFNDAYAMNSAAHAAQTELLGLGHPHTLMTAGGLSGDLRSLGRYQEALDQDARTYVAWLEVVGDDHPRTLMALNNLATSHRLMGHFKDARERDELVYQRRRVVLGDNHPTTFSSLGNWARDLRDAGEYHRSIDLLEGLVEMTRRASGPTSRDALNAQANLAVSLRSAGRSKEAATLLEETGARLRESQGASSPDSRAARLSLAVNLMTLNEFTRAQELMQEVHDEYLHSLGSLHPHRLVCVSNLAMVARALGDQAQAIDMASTAANELDTLLGPEHPFTLDSQTNLAISLAEGGRPHEAHSLLTKVLVSVTKVFGEEHPVTLRCLANLGIITQQVDRNDTDAEHARVLELLARRLGKDHRTVIDLREARLVSRTIDPHPF